MTYLEYNLGADPDKRQTKFSHTDESQGFSSRKTRANSITTKIHTQTTYDEVKKKRRPGNVKTCAHALSACPAAIDRRRRSGSHQRRHSVCWNSALHTSPHRNANMEASNISTHFKGQLGRPTTRWQVLCSRLPFARYVRHISPKSDTHWRRLFISKVALWQSKDSHYMYLVDVWQVDVIWPGERGLRINKLGNVRIS